MRFEQLQEMLGEERNKVHMISISIDPEQDTPTRLREYAKKFGAGPAWQHYTGTLAEGQPFASSLKSGPIELLLQIASPQNPGGVIAGMFEGLQKTGVGGKLKLHIPAALAYGDEGNSAIPPGAALIFEVEILARLPA